MSRASANVDPECWKSFFRNFLLLASLLLCPFPLQASDEAMVAELKKWYAEVTAQIRAGESSDRLQVLNRMLITSPELAALLGEDAARLVPGVELFAEGWQADVDLPGLHRAAMGDDPDCDAGSRMHAAALNFLPSQPLAEDWQPQGESLSPFVWASRLTTWVPDLARAPGRLA